MSRCTEIMGPQAMPISISTITTATTIITTIRCRTPDISIRIIRMAALIPAPAIIAVVSTRAGKLVGDSMVEAAVAVIIRAGRC